MVQCHNKSDVLLSHNPIMHSRTKYMEIDLFFVIEMVLAKQPRVINIHDTGQWAYELTKPLAFIGFLILRDICISAHVHN